MIVGCAFVDQDQKQIASWVSDEMGAQFRQDLDSQFYLIIPNLNLTQHLCL